MPTARVVLAALNECDMGAIAVSVVRQSSKSAGAVGCSIGSISGMCKTARQPAGGPPPSHGVLGLHVDSTCSCTPLTARLLQHLQAEQLRDEIISSMFRALVSDTPAIFSAARCALERIMKVAKIPKNLLQNSLRPILQNLGDYRRLTLRLLHGLGRLLELLSDW